MTKSLVIVESPAKARTINKFLGSAYIVKPTGGHVIDLPEKEFGVDISNGFVPEYRVIKGKQKILNDLKKAAEKVDTILLATDPDREGEAIAWHIAQRIVGEHQKSFRVLINQITKNAVLHAVENKGELDLKRVYAQQARRVLDRLVGYKVSPLLWKTIFKGLSAGRVQSVALRMIVERDEAISVFIPEEYWKIKALVSTDGGEPFEADLIKYRNDPVEVKTSGEAEKIVGELSTIPFIVKGVMIKKTKRYPAPPFITSTLQQEASRRIGFSVSKTMKVAQTLYEGIELADGFTGLITYMRTDSTRVAPEALSEVRSFIVEKWGKDHIPSEPIIYRTKKGAQDAHEAVRPASMSRTPDEVKSFLTPDQVKLYTLIWNKFVASQMRPAEYTVETIDIGAGDYELRSRFQVCDYKGFLMIYEESESEEDDATILEKLPKISEGVSLIVQKISPSQHFTKPPFTFTEASLVKELEAQGIGRPSTYAQIINTILTRKYIHRENGKLKATDLGKQVTKLLVQGFPNVFTVDFTANMEDELDKVESGECEWLAVVKDFYHPFTESLEKMAARTKELKKSLIETTELLCEKCGKPMVIRWGRNGKFIACSGFPECKNTRPLENEEPNVTDEVCEKCGAPMKVKEGRYGKFLACSNYPQCKNVRAFTMGVKCPERGCDGEIVKKKTKRGRIFYGCSRFPKCSFASWEKPVAMVCPECDSPTLIEAKNGEQYTCPRCKSVFDKESL